MVAYGCSWLTTGSWIPVLISGKEKLRPSFANCQLVSFHRVILALSLVPSLEVSSSKKGDSLTQQQLSSLACGRILCPPFYLTLLQSSTTCQNPCEFMYTNALLCLESTVTSRSSTTSALRIFPSFIPRPWSNVPLRTKHYPVFHSLLVKQFLNSGPGA